jgi:chromate transporter
MLYLQLFLSFFKTGLLGFGGGMAIISLIQNEVLRYGWMTETEFVDIVAISQVTPGPIGINCATYVGYTATGSIWGSLLATAAIILPSILIMLAIIMLYQYIQHRWSENRTFKIIMRVIRIAVVLLVAHAAYTLITPATFPDKYSWLIFAFTLLFMLLPDIGKLTKTTKYQRHIQPLSHPVLLIILAGLAGWCIYA